MIRLDELTKRNVEVIAKLEESTNLQRPKTDRLADYITQFVGSMWFVYFHIAWFAIWVTFNALPGIPKSWVFDPFPFTFLTFVVSLEAIFLSTFILISQNHEDRLAQRRSHLDLQINLLSEQENSKILQMLSSIQQHLGIDVDREVLELEKQTDPDSVAKQIEEAIENGDQNLLRNKRR